jgi:ubiquinone/menaquinone biosynthesis C-methylase UbiE
MPLRFLKLRRSSSLKLTILKDRLWKFTGFLAKTVAKMPNFQGYLLHMTEDKKILDVGCGYGSSHSYLNKAKEIVGLDINREFVRYAKKCNPLYNYVIADCRMLPFRNGAFDITTMIMVLHHLPSYESVLRAVSEASRVSKEIIVLDYSISASFIGMIEKTWLKMHDHAMSFMTLKHWKEIAIKTCKRTFKCQISYPIQYFCLIHYY